jgi:glycerol-3-phosphate dehydrogenase (NAD(P)+)
MARIGVVGTTSWGTTLAVLLARNGHETLLWARNADEASTLDAARENARHRPGLPFPASLSVSAAPSQLGDCEAVFIAVPSATLTANLDQLAPHLGATASVVSAVKGLEVETARRISEVLEATGVSQERILALSGPNFAGEIAAGLPAASVVAGTDADRAREAQSLLNSATFRVYTSDDVAGVEIGGALKNVVAIACGISDGLGYGENAKAALITRALAEITRLGVALGARPLTFLGLAGIGDLVLSCQSNQSRNRRLGLALASGQALEEAITSIDGVVEGAVTARCIPMLTKRARVEMPICEALHAVLYESKAPQDAVRELMSRIAKPEF